MPMMGSFYPPVLADGRIYWQPLKPPGGNGKGNNMLVFDTMAESFQHLLSPVEGGGFPELFEMSNGALGLYDTLGHGTADLWVLQDHTSWTWSLNNRIKLPADVLSVMPVLNPEGDVLVLSGSFECHHLQHISGANGSLLARYEWNDSLNLRRHRFRESLVRHDFFSMEGNAGGVDEKPLFDALSTVALLRDDNSEPH
jgi:hypothetical protein